jgi:small subunit ribosomal protein S6
MKKNRKGHYVLFNIDAPWETVAEMERQMRISEDVLRYMTIRVDALDEGPSIMMQARQSRDDRPRRDSFRGGRDDRPKRDDGERPKRDDGDRPKRDDGERPKETAEAAPETPEGDKT